MSFSGRVILSTLIGLVIAGLVHIIFILYVPHAPQNSAYQRLQALTRNGESVVLPNTGANSWPRQQDPYVTLSACLLNTRESAMLVSFPKSNVFQSLSIHDRQGRVLLSATDRAATGESLDIVVGTATQIADFLKKQGEREDTLQELHVIMEENTGFAVLRTLSPLASTAGLAREAAEKLSCKPLKQGAD
ncbi:MAG: hypothetical protein LBR29_07220 [Methylobacteriaceae bacterium]|jgi:uncharacterized membrane protein|nr:hypothetical protein [Methylobacteriaceae bacterium]